MSQHDSPGRSRKRRREEYERDDLSSRQLAEASFTTQAETSMPRSFKASRDHQGEQDHSVSNGFSFQQIPDATTFGTAEPGAPQEDSRWEFMATRHFLDAPIRTSSYFTSWKKKKAKRLKGQNGESLDAPSTINHPLYVNQGPMYSSYLSSRFLPDDPTSLPSEDYMGVALEPPSLYDPLVLRDRLNEPNSKNGNEPKDLLPRHLLVLDLNGTLLFRSKGYDPADKQRRLWRRPYLSCFVQYLAHERTRNGLLEVETDRKKKYFLIPESLPSEESAGAHSRKHRGKSKRKMEGNGQEIRDQIADLKKNIKKHPDKCKILAPLDAMIWSSVQPQNLLRMVDASFGSSQSVLRACWTRDMLGLDSKGYHNKVQTTKNLERIWWSSKDRYSKSGTLLLDDTSLKARLQPWNLLHISEYVASKSTGGKAVLPNDQAMRPHPEEEPPANHPNSSDPPPPDTTLLAVIGILEESRTQTNIPAWIRGGALWGDMSPPGAEGNDAIWSSNSSVIAYWSEKGAKILRSRGIPVEIGNIPVTAEELSMLRNGVY
ncbi:hypothetical protein CPB86DRAFT_637683 [Serendipita vermifera]|nr:hypothetical protein CPB86DRAFT_637683 [Serendipita vermifera]